MIALSMPGGRRTVGVGDLAVSADRGDVLVTYALGSCVGVTAHDPVAGVGGLLHAMLPTSSLDPERAGRAPATYVDTGLALLLAECVRLGARRSRLVVSAAGGAALWQSQAGDHFQIGRRNVVALRQLLWKEGLLLRSHDVGGSQSRTMSLTIADGEVLLTTYDPTSTRPRQQATLHAEAR